MKQEYAADLTEDLLTMTKPQIVIELPNGQKMATENYYHDEDGNGKMVIVIKAGRKLR